MGLASVLVEILSKPTIGDVFGELVMFVAPLWVAVIVGVLVGWVWKPKWANLGGETLDVFASKDASRESSSSRLGFGSIPVLNALKFQLPSSISRISDDGVSKEGFSSQSNENDGVNRSPPTQAEKGTSGFVSEEDLKYLYQLVEVEDGGPAWIHMMDRSTPTMTYQAWRRDMENGPPQYRSRTVYENATPEMVRDFFWDNEFRLKWDDMHVHDATLEESRDTGAMVVQWVRKFPFFCSDREYIVGRRIWDAGRVYYCVTKGVPYPSVPRRNKPRRVDLYFSSWCIRAVESRKGDDLMTACEVTLFHYEDMGIPWEIAKLGVRQGMWGAVKTAEAGLRAYQKHRASGEPFSASCLLARINSKVTVDHLRSLEASSGDSSSEIEILDSSQKPSGKNLRKLLIVGGAVAVACSLDKGLLTKAIIFGVARRFANIGRRM